MLKQLILKINHRKFKYKDISYHRNSKSSNRPKSGIDSD
jgi:hypothetical protein